MKPKLTVGMAVKDDFDGIFFTINSARLNNDIADIQWLIVDNSQSESTSSRIRDWLKRVRNSKYVRYTESQGTSKTRDLVFEYADSDYVLCMDSHVLLPPATLNQLIQFYQANPETSNLYQGPILLDVFPKFETHFDGGWGAGMHGKWATAYEHVDSGEFVDMRIIDDKIHLYEILSRRYVGNLTMLPGETKEKTMAEAGYYLRGFPNDECFEIPAMGLGLFSCRRDAWPKFCSGPTEHVDGFGGEEWNIHEAFRQRGDKCFCLPFLRWSHKFTTSNTVDIYKMARNYVLWYMRLNKSFTPIYEHYVKGVEYPEKDGVPGKYQKRLLSESNWEYLLKDPINHRERKGANCSGKCKNNEQECCKSKDLTKDEVKALLKDIHSVYLIHKSVPRDLERHMPFLKAISNNCGSVLEISKRKESCVSFIAGTADVTSYNCETDELLSLTEIRDFSVTQIPNPYESFEEYSNFLDHTEFGTADAVYLDTFHAEKQIQKELNIFKDVAKKWIIIRGTDLFGFHDEVGKGVGLLKPIYDFVENSSDWEVVYRTSEQSGMMVLSRNGEQRLPYTAGICMKRLLLKLAISPKKGCSCKKIMMAMDKLSLDELHKGYSAFVDAIKNNKKNWGWTPYHSLKTSWNYIKTGLIFKCGIIDPIKGLVEYAIDMAEEPIEGKGEFYDNLGVDE